ncbi:MAG: hypothetical protein PVF58_11160 [Candidatus Methanofastidiosia archaeon]
MNNISGKIKSTFGDLAVDKRIATRHENNTKIKLGLHRAHLPSLTIKDAMVNRDMVEAYPNLLTTG